MTLSSACQSEKAHDEIFNHPFFVESCLTIRIVFFNARCELLGSHASIGIRRAVGLVANSGSSEFHGDREKPDIDRKHNGQQIQAPIEANDIVDVVTAPFLTGNVVVPRH
jgi:hypothetical protein